tara:strand:+ start:76624 stop:76992 length:369 start_codon:yes stop_codon:yes gene_type:complete
MTIVNVLGETKDFLNNTISLGDFCVYRKGNFLGKGVIVDMKTRVKVVWVYRRNNTSDYQVNGGVWVDVNEMVVVSDEQMYNILDTNMLYCLATVRGRIQDDIEKNTLKHERVKKKRLEKKEE